MPTTSHEEMSSEGLRALGFAAPVTIGSLWADGLVGVPNERRVYVVLYQSSLPPTWRKTSWGGHHKGRDPSVSLSELEQAWVPGACIVYIGKGGGDGREATLRSRLKQYLRFGRGHNVGHWGGRYIWQIDGCETLSISWRVTPQGDPREVERRMIADFVKCYGKRPFANLAD